VLDALGLQKVPLVVGGRIRAGRITALYVSGYGVGVRISTR
jgi:hypothetical protein